MHQTIPWFPTVNHDKCIGCELCFVTCGRGVYKVRDHKAWPDRPYDCMVGCTSREFENVLICRPLQSYPNQ
jgi:Fe-S-cluster-containing hydrogenase component 2